MKRFLPLLLLLSCLSPLFSQNRPNILVLIADDMGTDAFSAYNLGTDLPHTPHLDNLASEGLLFTNAWTYPTCAPSRASLLTGRYGNKTGIMRSGPNLPSSEVTLFEHLKSLTNDAYTAGVFGKWHLGNANHPNNNGADYYVGNLSSGVENYFEWERTLNGNTDTSTAYVTTYTTDEAINWLDTQSQPWLCWMAYNAPHGPFHLPPDSLYTRTDTASTFDKYLCMIESVDHEIGRLLASLSQAERDSTLILFVGDNGTPNGQLQAYPNRHGKGTVYEGGIRVPMFMVGYGVDRINEQETALVSFSDLFATLTELLGTDLPGGVNNSFSFLPLLNDPNAATRPYNYSELEEDGMVAHAIRNEQYKLIIQGDDTEEFYDLLTDELEEDDLLENGLSTAQQAVYEELREEADSVFFSWSCNDDIQNGDEEDIDCGGSSCADCGSVEIKDTDNEEIALYPNPVLGELHIEAKGAILHQVKVFDLNGRLVLDRQLENRLEAQLDLSPLPPGNYLVEVTTSYRGYRQIITRQ